MLQLSSKSYAKVFLIGPLIGDTGRQMADRKVNKMSARSLRMATWVTVPKLILVCSFRSVSFCF